MSEEQQEKQPTVNGPGQILKEAREKLGLSTADIAAKLHLKQVAIQAIENDEYDPAISLTFTKGYLKLYAKQVDVPEQEVMFAFEQHHTQDKEPAKLQSFSKRVAKQASDDRLMMITYLIIAVVVALVVVWWFQQGPTEPVATQLTASDDEQQQSISSQGTALQDTGSQSLATNTATDDSSTPGDSLSPTTDDLIVSGQIESQELAVTTQSQQVDDVENVADDMVEQGVPIELVFTFADNCWMNLVDSTGEAIAYGVKKSGRVMPVTGIPPFEVTLGAPEVVQITYDGVAVDMSRFDAGKTAKFFLPFAQ